MKIYLNSSDRFYAEPSRKDLPHVTHFGKAQFSTALPPLPPHTHAGAMELVYLARGRVTYEVNRQSYSLRGGDVFLTFPHEIHGTGTAPQERGTMYWIGIDMENPGRNFLGYADSQAIHLFTALKKITNRHFRGSSELQQFFERFIESMMSELSYRRIIARGAVTEILERIIRLEKELSTPNISPEIMHCISWIDKHTEEPVLLEQLASVANLSLSHFKYRFRSEIGMPPYEFVLHKKIERAKDLLLENKWSVTDIAFRLGFPSSQHFATTFRKITSQTPTGFVSNRKSDSF